MLSDFHARWIGKTDSLKFLNVFAFTFSLFLQSSKARLKNKKINQLPAAVKGMWIFGQGGPGSPRGQKIV